MFLGKTHVHVSYGWIWLLRNLYSCIYILWKKKTIQKTVILTKPYHFLTSFNNFFLYIRIWIYSFLKLWKLPLNKFSSHRCFFLNQWYALLWFIWIMMVMIISEKDYKWIVYFFLQRLTSLKIEIAFHRLRQSLLACH